MRTRRSRRRRSRSSRATDARPMNLDHLDWPFFDDAHRALGRELERVGRTARRSPTTTSMRRAARWVRALGAAGFLRHCVPAAHGGVREKLDSRSLCVARETLAYADGPRRFRVRDAGPRQRADHARGQRGAAAALVADGGARRGDRRVRAVRAGSRLGRASRSATRATRDGDGWRIDGCKTWISNGGIADFYCVFARTGESAGREGHLGVRRARRYARSDASPNASTSWRRIRSRGSRSTAAAFPPTRCSAHRGEGFKLAMRTLDIFRASVAAAAIGFARRALDEAAQHAQGNARCSAARSANSRSRRRCSATWRRRSMRRRCSRHAPRGSATYSGARTTREAAMAKLAATESAQQVIDAALQLHGARGRARGRDRRAAVPRDPRAAHLRGRDRSAEAHRRARSAEVVS